MSQLQELNIHLDITSILKQYIYILFVLTSIASINMQIIYSILKGKFYIDVLSSKYSFENTKLQCYIFPQN